MKNVLRLFQMTLATIVLLSISGTAQPATAPNFEGLRNRWIHNLESQDLEGSLALYSTDATLTNPDGTHVSGPALRELYKIVFGAFRAKILMSPRSHAFSGTLAYEAGSYTEDLTRIENGEIQHVSGDYLTVYREADSGGWLIVEQVWTETPHK